MASKKKKKPAPQPVAATPAPKADPYAQYGVQIALVNSNTELKSLFTNAVAEGWTADTFSSRLQNTDWYKNHSIAWRGAETARLTDPGQWAASVEAAKNQINAMSARMGFSLDEASINSLAEQTLYTSWGQGIDDTVLRKHIFEMGKITGTGGEAVTTIDQLKQDAYKNGQTYTDDWYDTAVRGVVGQGKLITDYQNMIKEDAKSQYASLATKIDAGMSVREAAAGYISKMAQVFEINDTDVNLNDPLMSRALKNIDAQGNATAVPQWEFERMLKTDDRYFKTNQAHEDFSGFANALAKTFGKA